MDTEHGALREATRADLRRLATLLDEHPSPVGPGAQLQRTRSGVPGAGPFRRVYVPGSPVNAFLSAEVVTTQLRTALLSIWVHPERRREGLAEHLLRSFAQRAPGYGIENFDVVIDRANTAALRFFAKHGFAACGSIDGYAHCVRNLPLGV